MAQYTHINVTMDFSNRLHDGKQYDLRIPIQLTVKQLLLYVMETLNLEFSTDSKCAIKILTKKLLITDDDVLTNFPVTDGDIFLVL